MIVYHGSDNIIKYPQFGGSKADNDYGSGFYTTQDQDSAREWAVINGSDRSSICNKYELSIDQLNVLQLDSFGTLSWIAEVIFNRGTDSENNEEIGQMIVEKYKVDVSDYDIIIGYRADDSYTKVIDAFLENKVTIDEVDKLFREGKLGKQVFLRSEKAFNCIEFIDFEKVFIDDKYGDNEKKARIEVSGFLKNRERAIQIEGLNVSSIGLTARDAINNKLILSDGHYH